MIDLANSENTAKTAESVTYRAALSGIAADFAGSMMPGRQDFPGWAAPFDVHNFGGAS